MAADPREEAGLGSRRTTTEVQRTQKSFWTRLSSVLNLGQTAGTSSFSSSSLTSPKHRKDAVQHLPIFSSGQFADGIVRCGALLSRAVPWRAPPRAQAGSATRAAAAAAALPARQPRPLEPACRAVPLDLCILDLVVP